MLTVLYVCHNHPSIRPGGAETYADELYRAIRESKRYRPIFVTKVGPPHTRAPRRAARFGLASDQDPHLYTFYTHTDEFDRLLWTASDKRIYTRDWRDFLEAQRPDVVHFHHAAWLGYDLVRETRHTLPDAALIYTLHDFGAICHHNGQMVRKRTLELCHRASPQRCNRCFPEVTPEQFFLRERFVSSGLEPIDVFIAPSAHARQRFIEWGLPEHKVVHENYGRFEQVLSAEPAAAGARRRLGFFGQITEYKGVDVLLEAMRILERADAGVQLLVHGANLEHQRAAFREHIRRLLAETARSVHFCGEYDQAELPRLMSAVDWIVVPSIWWETGPLVIHEAMMHRRPVICSDIGAMAERVRDGVNGLHFRTRDPHSLADTIRRAVDSPELWARLRDNLQAPHSMSAHLDTITGIYDRLVADHARAVALR